MNRRIGLMLTAISVAGSLLAVAGLLVPMFGERVRFYCWSVLAICGCALLSGMITSILPDDPVKERRGFEVKFTGQQPVLEKKEHDHG